MQETRTLNLEELHLKYPSNRSAIWAYRARVPGGWLIFTSGDSTLTAPSFYPDPKHVWDGGTEEAREP